MLHFKIKDQNQIAAVDVHGVTQKIIPMPTMAERKRPKSWLGPGYVAQSQGRLHYINQTSDAELFIWVLEDYDAQAWVLKAEAQCELYEAVWKKRVAQSAKMATVWSPCIQMEMWFSSLGTGT